MAYGNKDTTIDNFEENIEEETFEQLTSITLEEFKKLRDGFDYEDDEGNIKTFKGLFNKTVFNSSIKEFFSKKEELSDYFDESIEGDIFDYIPPQETNQIYTPKVVVKMMVDLLEKENPQIFRSKNKKFIDLYTKSGLFITEIITRLFNGIKDQIPDEHQRLKWIIENQVYAVAPTNIIYNIAKNFIMGNFEGISDKNIVEYDLTKAAEKGKVAEKLNELYGGKNLKFDVVIGNPPYQETISKHSGNKSLAKQLFPMFTKEAIELNSRYVSLIIPARWFAGDAQDKSFVRLREYLRQNNHIKQMYYFEDAREIFPNVEIKGGVCYFLYDKEYNGTVNFYNSLKGKVLLTKRNLFVDDLDIILTSSIDLHILEKVLSSKFTSLTSITKGRNAFGIIGKDEHVASISEDSPFDGSCELRCKFNEIRYIKPELVQKNKDILKITRFLFQSQLVLQERIKRL